MKFNNTNDYKNQQRLFLKFFVGFVLLWVHCLQGQLSILVGASIYAEGGNYTKYSDIDSETEENNAKAKIYISSEIKILIADSETNYEIIKISDTKKSISSNNKATKNSKHKKAKAEPAKQNVAQKLPKNEQAFTSEFEADYALFVQNHSTIIAQIQNPVLKNFLKIGFTYFHTYTLDSAKTKIPNGLTHFTGKIYSESYSVRPPPKFL